MDEPSNIYVIVAEDHDYVRLSLSIFIETTEGLALIGEAGNGQEALELTEQLIPDVVLIDLIMPVMNSIEATEAIKHSHPEVKVIVLTGTIESNLLQEALEAGADRISNKTTSNVELKAVILSMYHA
jgi:DNA-binding NarL/FixJ family response regulator